jgi:hypothetical protein
MQVTLMLHKSVSKNNLNLHVYNDVKNNMRYIVIKQTMCWIPTANLFPSLIILFIALYISIFNRR